MADGSTYDHVTTNHDEIKRWVRQRGGEPVEAEDGDETPITVAFPSTDARATGEPLDWEGFFDRFESAGLAFAYATAPATDGIECAVVDRDRAPTDDEPLGEAARADTPDRARLDEQRAEARGREAADEANADGHRDEPPFNS